MSKIKLSILLLISFFILSCTNNQINQYNQKYSLAYIGGEYDGLVLSNKLKSYLQGYDRSFKLCKSQCGKLLSSREKIEENLTTGEKTVFEAGLGT